MTTPRIIEVGDKPDKVMLMLGRKGWGIHNMKGKEVGRFATLERAIRVCNTIGINTRKQKTVS